MKFIVALHKKTNGLIWLTVMAFGLWLDHHHASAKARQAADQARQANIPAAPITLGYVNSGSSCTDDCSGHDAGYSWARQHMVSDPDECLGHSQSFSDGCKEYVADQASPY